MGSVLCPGVRRGNLAVTAVRQVVRTGRTCAISCSCGGVPAMKVMLVAGARPNFMKVAPLFHAFSRRKELAREAGIDLRVSIVHTGQHYDPNMSDIFFRELEMPAPDRHLDVGP